MASYHIGVASVAACADEKWIDNLLSRFRIPDVEHTRQGVSRRISLRGVQHIVLARRLSANLAVSTGSALVLAARVLASSRGSVTLGDGIELRIDLQAFFIDVESRVADAVESLAPRRRGRPPKNSIAPTQP